MRLQFIGILLFLTQLALAQEMLFVGAQSGLIVRELPDINSPKIATFHYGEKVELIERTKTKITLNDHGNNISARWYKLKSTSALTPEITGYAFGGYLTREEISHGNKTVVTNGYELKIIETTSAEFYSIPAPHTALLSEADCIKAGNLSITSPVVQTLRLSDSSLFTLSKPKTDEQFFGYNFVGFDTLRNFYLVWENWLEAGHPILIHDKNGEITPVMGTNYCALDTQNRVAFFAADIDAGWTPNGIQLVDIKEYGIGYLFELNPVQLLKENWGPVEAKWADESTLLLKCIMPNAEGDYLYLYKKLQFQRVF